MSATVPLLVVSLLVAADGRVPSDAVLSWFAAHMPDMNALKTTQNRQSKGQPIGGEFAPHARDESGVNLGQEGLSPAEILQTSIQLSRQAAYRLGLSPEDAEDVAQETVFSVLRTQSRNGGAAVNGGLIRVASNALVSRLVDSHSRHEDSRAYREWKLEVQQVEFSEGRHLTAKELDAIATKIRNNWPNPRHKPSVGFQHETKLVYVDAHSPDFADSLMRDGGATAEGSFEQFEVVHKLGTGELTKPVVRRQMWNLINVDATVPESVRGSVSEAKARAYDNTVPDAVVTADAWLNGTATPAETEALFAPFGSTTDAEKTAAANAIKSKPAFGHKLWRSALDYSNRKFND